MVCVQHTRARARLPHEAPRRPRAEASLARAVAGRLDREEFRHMVRGERDSGAVPSRHL
jgi:hypothetical protein